MAAVTIRLPNAIHQKIKDLAKREKISVSQFIASAAAEKMASIMTLDYLRAEAAEGKRSDFNKLQKMVPDAPVVKGDEQS